MADVREGKSRRQEERETFELFLKSRKKNETREYARAILECLSDQFDKDLRYRSEHLSEKEERQGVSSAANFGWVRTKDLFDRVKIPNESTFYKLLSDLKKAKLIRRQERERELLHGPGKIPTYYRVPGVYSRDVLRALMSFKSKEELIQELDKERHNVAAVRMRLTAAQTLLARCHNEDPDFDVDCAIDKEMKDLPGLIIAHLISREKNLRNR